MQSSLVGGRSFGPRRDHIVVRVLTDGSSVGSQTFGAEKPGGGENRCSSADVPILIPFGRNASAIKADNCARNFFVRVSPCLILHTRIPHAATTAISMNQREDGINELRTRAQGDL